MDHKSRQKLEEMVIEALIDYFNNLGPSAGPPFEYKGDEVNRIYRPAKDIVLERLEDLEEKHDRLVGEKRSLAEALELLLGANPEIDDGTRVFCEGLLNREKEAHTPE